MLRKMVFLTSAIATMLLVSQAWAQSSHDAVVGADADLKDRASDRFEISSTDGRFKLGFRGHLQQNNELLLKSRVAVGGWDPKLDIEIKRARLSLYGSALDPRVTFLIQTGYEIETAERRADRLVRGNNFGNPGSDILWDYYMNFHFNRYVQVRVGKFRSPFSRQQLMSTSQMQFPDQNLANNTFQITESGRDVGIMAHNGFDGPIEWAAAVVTNGLVGRVGYNHGAIDGYEMVDFSRHGLRFGVAANGFLHSDFKSAAFNDFRAGIDFIVKYQGFSTNGAFYYQMDKGAATGRPGRPATLYAAARHNIGFGVDAGYLFAWHLEPVLRFAWTKTGEPANNAIEILGGVNYYVYGHHLKVQGYGGPTLSKTAGVGAATGIGINKWNIGAQLQFAI